MGILFHTFKSMAFCQDYVVTLELVYYHETIFLG